MQRGRYGVFFIVNPDVYSSWKGDDSRGFINEMSDNPQKDEANKLLTGSKRDNKWGHSSAQFYFHSEDDVISSLDGEGMEITDRIDYYYKDAGASVPGRRKLIKFRKP